MILNQEQQEELRRLKRNVPDFDVVYNAVKALQAGGANTDPLWEYYYPICLHKAWEFFDDPEDGHNAAFDLMEHWLKSVLTYDEEKAKLSPFFDKVAKNFFINRKEHLDLGPDIIYGGTPYDNDGGDPDEEEYVLAQRSAPAEIGPDYPYAILQDGPATYLEAKERALTIRKKLTGKVAEVFDLLIQGDDSTLIAEKLDMTENAVALCFTKIRKLT